MSNLLGRIHKTFLRMKFFLTAIFYVQNIQNLYSFILNFKNIIFPKTFLKNVLIFFLKTVLKTKLQENLNARNIFIFRNFFCESGQLYVIVDSHIYYLYTLYYQKKKNLAVFNSCFWCGVYELMCKSISRGSCCSSNCTKVAFK